MKKNMALGERLLRLIAGVVLLILFFVKSMVSPWTYVVLILSLFLVSTALGGSCPAYQLFHIDTRQFKEQDEIR